MVEIHQGTQPRVQGVLSEAVRRKVVVSFYGVAAAVILMCCGDARGDALTDLRGRLATLTAKTPVRAVAELQSTTTSKDEGDAKSGSAHVSVPVEMNEQGLSITFPRALLSDVAKEKLADQKAPQKSGQLAKTVNSIRAVNLAEALDAAPALLADLTDAKLLSDQAGSFNGAPARLLDIAIDPHLSKEESKHVKSIEVHLRVWLGADGLPLYTEVTHKVRASFLLLSFESTGVEKSTYLRRDDRLIVTHRDSEESGSGMGQSSKNHDVLTITLH